LKTALLFFFALAFSIEKKMNVLFARWLFYSNVEFQLDFGITYNVSAMVSTGIKSNEFPIKHLAKTFYFVLSFHF